MICWRTPRAEFVASLACDGGHHDVPDVRSHQEDVHRYQDVARALPIDALLVYGREQQEAAGDPDHVVRFFYHFAVIICQVFVERESVNAVGAVRSVKGASSPSNMDWSPWKYLLSLLYFNSLFFDP